MFFEEGGCTQHCLEIHEVHEVWWLKYGPCFHEGIDHLVDAIVNIIGKFMEILFAIQTYKNFSLHPILTM